MRNPADLASGIVENGPSWVLNHNCTISIAEICSCPLISMSSTSINERYQKISVNRMLKRPTYFTHDSTERVYKRSLNVDINLTQSYRVRPVETTAFSWEGSGITLRDLSSGGRNPIYPGVRRASAVAKRKTVFLLNSFCLTNWSRPQIRLIWSNRLNVTTITFSSILVKSIKLEMSTAGNFCRCFSKCYCIISTLILLRDACTINENNRESKFSLD